MMSLGLSFISDVITFDQNRDRLCLTSAGEKDLSSHTQIKLFSPMEPEICKKKKKNQKNIIKKSKVNFFF